MVKNPERVVVTTLTCLRCGHQWTARQPRKPKVCPKCKHQKWQQPKRGTR